MFDQEELQDQLLFDYLNWPDEQDFSIFDLVLPSAVRTSISTQKQRIISHLNKNEVLLEKIAFTFGVTLLYSGSFIAGHSPNLFPSWYTGFALLLFSIRFYTYYKKKWHYFCFDLCYFVNLLVLIWLHFPRRELYYAVFMLSNGPISWAILAWRNSMVFHSLDKVITVFIHLAPPVLMFCLRWLCKNEAGNEHYLIHGSNPLNGMESMNYLESLFYSLLFYMLWQTLYFICIVILKGQKVDQGLRMTSYSWLLDHKKNEKNPSLMYKLCDISYFENNGMAKIFMFMFWQWIYALVTLSPVALFYKHFYLHLSFVLLMMTMCIWNGASYYLEVFRKVSGLKLERSIE